MKRLAILALISSIVLALSGCSASTDPGAETPSAFAANVVQVSNISSATTWSASSVYYISGTIYINAALTIPAGTVVKFAADAELRAEAGSQINAIGTAAAPIVFTSIKDDSAGGDSNLDGAASSPASGECSGTAVLANSSTFQYCEFRYMQNGLYLNGASNVTIQNCVFTNDGKSPTAGFALDAASAGPGLAMGGNSFASNYRPLAIDISQSVDATNVFHIGSALNAYPGIWVAGNLGQAVRQSNTEVAYVFGGITYVNAALTLANGVCFKFADPSAELRLEAGTLSSGSIVTEGIMTFTSLKDDTVKGDTNGDGSASAPAVNDWYGYWDYNLAGGTGAYVQNTTTGLVWVLYSSQHP